MALLFCRVIKIVQYVGNFTALVVAFLPSIGAILTVC
jgi:hypothetical protein